MNRRYLMLAFAVLASAACSKPETKLSRVSLALPLAVQDAEYRVLRLTQLGHSREYAIGAQGEVSASVVAGIPLDVEVTILGLDRDGAIPAIALYSSARSFIPRVGSATIDIDLSRAPSQEGSVVPVYEIGGVRYPVNANVTIVDVATGTVFASWHPQADEPFELALGRAYEIRVDSLTDTDGVAVFPLTADSFAPATELVIASPSLPLADVRLPAIAGQGVDLLAGDARLVLECSTDPACGATATYQQTLPIIVGLDTTYALGCRYQNVPSLCFAVTVAASSRQPILTLVANPPYIPPGGGAMSVDIQADEPIEANSAHLTIGTTELCGAPTALNANTVRCDFLASALTSDPADLVGTAENLYGNMGQASLHLRSLAADQTVLITGVRLYPARTSTRSGLLLGMDFAGLAPAGSPRADVTATCTVLATPPGVPLPSDAPFPATNVDFSVSDDGSPGRGTLWTTLTDSSDVVAGNYTVRLQLAAGSTTDTADFTFTIDPPSVRWITNGRLVYSVWSQVGSLPLPLDSPPVSYTSSNPAVVAATSFNGAPALAMVAPGTAMVTARATSDDAVGNTAEIEVAPGPALAFLQVDTSHDVAQSSVLVLDNLTVTQSDVSPAIGRPLRLLWEPSTDQLVVVGKTGLAGVAPSTLLVTALPESIIDAALLPQDSGHSARAAVLMANDLVADSSIAFVDLNTGAVSAPQPILEDGCNSRFDKLVYHVLTGELTAISAQCVVTIPSPYSMEGKTVGSRGTASPYTDLQPDPTTGYVVGTVSPPNGAWGTTLGIGAESIGPLAIDPFVTDAVSIDPRHGTPLTAGWNTSASTSVIASFGRLGVETSRILTYLPDLRVARLLVDPTDQILFVVTQETTPRLLVYDLDTGAALSLPMAVPSFAAMPVVDAVLMGPQVFSVATGSVVPGGLVTLRGSGFPADGTALAYIQGLAAEIVSSSPTTLIARVPAQLADLPFGAKLTVGVRAHNRLVQGPVATTLVNEPALFDLPAVTAVSGCPGTTETYTVLSSPYMSVLATISNGLRDTTSCALVAGTASNIANPTFAGDGRRVLAHYDSGSATSQRSWVETRPDLGESRSVFMTSGTILPTPVSIVADPTNRLLVFLNAQEADLYWATTYVPASATITLSTASAAGGITPDGQTLMVLGNGNTAIWLAAFDLSAELSSKTAPPTLSTQIGTTCPTGPPNFAVLTPDGSGQPGALLALLGNNSSLVVGNVERVGSTVTLTCTQQHTIANGTHLATLSPSGRLVAVADAKNNVQLLTPASSRQRSALFSVNNLPDSLALTPEQPKSGTSVLITTPTPSLYNSIAR